jgi:hypothetical protein
MSSVRAVSGATRDGGFGRAGIDVALGCLKPLDGLLPRNGTVDRALETHLDPRTASGVEEMEGHTLRACRG